MTHASGICLILRSICIHQSPTIPFLQNGDQTSEEPTGDRDGGGKPALVDFEATRGDEQE